MEETDEEDLKIEQKVRSSILSSILDILWVLQVVFLNDRLIVICIHNVFSTFLPAHCSLCWFDLNSSTPSHETRYLITSTWLMFSACGLYI